MWDFGSILSARRLRDALICLTGLVLLGAPAASRAGSVAYEVAADGYFGTINLQTGQFTQIGSAPLYEMNQNNLDPAGLAEVGGTLYTAEATTGYLYSINPQTGTDTYIGDGSNPSDGPERYALIGSTDNGVYGLQQIDIYGDAELFSVNTATGATTDIAEVTGAVLGYVGSLSTGSDTLYLTSTPLNGSSSTLYSINTTNGVATDIGEIGTDGGQAIRIGAMVDENGTLYGGEDLPNEKVVTLDTSTGASTFVANYNGGPNGNVMYGFAPDIPTSSTPLPSAATAGMALLVSLGATQWSRRSKRQMMS